MVRKEQTHARCMKPDTVDVLPVTETTFEKMWAKRRPIEQRGVGFHVPELEHLFAMKLHFDKASAHRAHHGLSHRGARHRVAQQQPV